MAPKQERPSLENANIEAPIVSSFNDRIRAVLDAVDKLRNLRVVEEGIQLPTIVVVGDQSSGKSSVLESLAGISLPRGQGICTRVPLVMRLQSHFKPNPELLLEFKGKLVNTDVQNVSDAIELATNEVAGSGKGISDSPLTLTVKKRGVPDLTMVDLPGITRVPVHGQPQNIYDQVKDIIMKYIKPEESIILNVLSATLDFPTCESIRLSQGVDKTGERTLAVVTKSDKSPEGLQEKVTSDDVNIGLGYVCVRNRIGDESYEEARAKEAYLFASHPLLSKINKSIVGVPILAQNLMQIQAKSIARNLPGIVDKINEMLNHNLGELNKLPKALSSAAEAMTVFMLVVGLAKDSLRKILIFGDFEEYRDENSMHCTARLVKMLNKYSDDLRNCDNVDRKKNFLAEEIKHLEEAKAISLPNFLPRAIFLALLGQNVNRISRIPKEFVRKLWDYIKEVVLKVVTRHCEDYSQLQISARRAVLSLVERMKNRSVDWVEEAVEMERVTDYTCNPQFESEWKKLMKLKEGFVSHLGSKEKPERVALEGFGDLKVNHLRKSSHDLVHQAFDMRMRMVAYWKVVHMRLVDSMALHMQMSVHKYVNKEFEAEIVNESISIVGIEKLMEESPSVATKRAKLNASIKKLKDCKDIMGTIVDKIGSIRGL